MNLIFKGDFRYMCKYCGKTCDGDICINCRYEQNAMLWDNDECVDLNSVFAIFGLLRFISLVALIIVTICGLTGSLLGNMLWLSIIFLTSMTFLFSKLRKMYHEQLAIVIDREMRKNHS